MHSLAHLPYQRNVFVIFSLVVLLFCVRFAVREALMSIGVSKEQQHLIWRVLAGILHLGNVEFADNPETGLAFICNPDVAAIAGEYLGASSLDVKLV